MTGDQLPRRLAAIVVADVVGYSRMMQAEEDHTFRRLRAMLANADCHRAQLDVRIQGPRRRHPPYREGPRRSLRARGFRPGNRQTS